MDLDRISKHILVKLAQLDEATASELKEALGLDQNQSIHYRMDEKLIPQGLVHEHPKRREQPGSRKAARVYLITARGEDWAEEHGHEITLSDLDEAEQEIQRISAELREITSHVQSLRDWKQEKSGEEGGVTTQLGKVRERVDEIEYLTNKHEGREYSEIWDLLHDLDEHTDRLSRKLDEPLATADDIEQVQNDIHSLENRLDSLESNLDDLSGTQGDFSDWSHKIDSRVQKLEQHASQGFLGRLCWLLFG